MARIKKKEYTSKIITTKRLILRPMIAQEKDILGYLACHQDAAARKNFAHVSKDYAEAQEVVKKICTKFPVVCHRS